MQQFRQAVREFNKFGANIIFIEKRGLSLRACAGDKPPARSLSQTGNVFLMKMMFAAETCREMQLSELLLRIKYL